MPHPSLIIFIPLFFYFFFIKSNGNNDPSLPPYCSQSRCGDFEVKYPFWVQNATSSAIQYCGYKGFGLNCSESPNSPDAHHLILQLPSDHSFYVKDINYANYTVTLVDIDVATNQTCPRPRQNLTLEDLPLGYSAQDLNLTFYFNCTRSLPPNASAHPMDCLMSGRNMSYVSLETDNDGETNHDFDWFEVCEEKVVAIVIEGVISNGLSLFEVAAMKEGFVLDWRSDIECARCELSKGHCGYNNSSKEFLCFCNDGRITYDKCKGTVSSYDDC